MRRTSRFRKWVAWHYKRRIALLATTDRYSSQRTERRLAAATATTTIDSIAVIAFSFSLYPYMCIARNAACTTPTDEQRVHVHYRTMCLLLSSDACTTLQRNTQPNALELVKTEFSFAIVFVGQLDSLTTFRTFWRLVYRLSKQAPPTADSTSTVVDPPTHGVTTRQLVVGVSRHIGRVFNRKEQSRCYGRYCVTVSFAVAIRRDKDSGEEWWPGIGSR